MAYHFDRRRLQAQMVLKGKNGKEVADKLKINEATFYRKMANDGDFTRTQIGTLIEFLDITNINEIFFAENVADTQ